MDTNAFHSRTLQGHRQIEKAIQKVDLDRDIHTLVQENSIALDDVKAEFLMTDYFVSALSAVTFVLRPSPALTFATKTTTLVTKVV